MAIYENTSTNVLSFSLVTSLVMSDYGSSNFNIYISPVDIPAIADIDYDGDLDILTFSILRKFRLNKSPVQPDNNHLHQLLFFYLHF